MRCCETFRNSVAMIVGLSNVVHENCITTPNVYFALEEHQRRNIAGQAGVEFETLEQMIWQMLGPNIRLITGSGMEPVVKTIYVD
jgi:hypothetical protein